MHEYVLRVDDTAAINQLLSLTDKEYIDIFFTKDFAMLVNNSSEVFGYLPWRCSGTDGEQAACRVDRVGLQKLLIEGFLVFTLNDTWVEVSFIDSENHTLYKLRFRNQQVNREEYQDKIDLLSRLTDDMFFNAGPLEPMCRLSRYGKSLLTVEDGVVSTGIGGRGRMFQEIDIAQSFSCTADKLYMLLGMSHRLFGIENYIGVKTRGIGVLVTKCRGMDNSEYNLFCEAKAAFMCTMDLRPLRAVVAKYDVKEDSIKVDMEKGEAVAGARRMQIVVPVPLSDVRKSAKCSLREISIPVSLIKKEFSRLKSCVFQFAQKRHAMLFECENIKFYI